MGKITIDIAGAPEIIETSESFDSAIASIAEAISAQRKAEKPPREPITSEQYMRSVAAPIIEKFVLDELSNRVDSFTKKIALSDVAALDDFVNLNDEKRELVKTRIAELK